MSEAGDEGKSSVLQDIWKIPFEPVGQVVMITAWCGVLQIFHIWLHACCGFFLMETCWTAIRAVDGDGLINLGDDRTEKMTYYSSLKNCGRTYSEGMMAQGLLNAAIVCLLFYIAQDPYNSRMSSIAACFTAFCKVVLYLVIVILTNAILEPFERRLPGYPGYLAAMSIFPACGSQLPDLAKNGDAAGCSLCTLTPQFYDYLWIATIFGCFYMIFKKNYDDSKAAAEGEEEPLNP